MSQRTFLDPATRAQAAQAVKFVEAQSAAEVVIAVRPASGLYRHADYLFGFCLAMVGLIALLFVDIEYEEWFVIVEVAALFAGGAVACAHLGGLRRLFSSKRVRTENVQRGAKAAFVEMGISHTHHRTGILVFASLFERAVVVVPDVGIDPKALGPEWEKARAALESSLISGPRADRLLAAVRALAAPLSKALPHVEGQLNELPDEPQAA
jgi:putative membrane protein